MDSAYVYHLIFLVTRLIINDIDYNTAYSICTKSSSYTCPRTISRYVAKSQGRRQHVGWCRSGRKLRFNINCLNKEVTLDAP